MALVQLYVENAHVNLGYNEVHADIDADMILRNVSKS
jgi:hypothetical protein